MLFLFVREYKLKYKQIKNKIWRSQVVSIFHFPNSLLPSQKIYVGELVKTLHPRNVGFAEFMNKFVSHLRGWKLYFARKETFMKKSWRISCTLLTFS
jgi:hypothetical protein